MKTQWLYGIHPVTQCIDNHPHRIKQALVQNTQTALSSRLRDLIKKINDRGIPLHSIRAEKLQRLVQGANHQGIALEVFNEQSISLPSLLKQLELVIGPKLLLVLDRIQDPQNLGSCFRSAHAAGASAIIATRWQSADLTPLARKISCGASEQLPFLQVSNLAEILRKLKEKNFLCIGLDLAAEYSIYQLSQFIDVKQNIALILGNEEVGIRQHVSTQCDLLIRIPMHSEAESLNVATAAAIAAFELQRQREVWAN